MTRTPASSRPSASSLFCALSFTSLLYSGALKALVPSLPLDPTALAIILVASLSIGSILSRGAVPAIPFAGVLFFVVQLMSWTYSSQATYAHQKLLGGVVAGGVLFLGGVILFRDDKKRLLLRNCLLLVVCALTVVGALGEAAAYGRGALGGSTIRLGQVAGMAVVLLVSVLNQNGLKSDLRSLVPLLFTSLFVVVLISSGSKGPILGAVIAIAISSIRLDRRSRSASRKRLETLFLVVMLGVAGHIGIGAAPESSSDRLTNTSSESTTLRFDALVESSKYAIDHPEGTGLGDFGEHISTFSESGRQYPHNLLAEITVEQGWIGAGTFCVMLFGALRGTLNSASPERSWIFSAILFMLFAAMFSGDLADNRALFGLVGLALGLPPKNSPGLVRAATESRKNLSLINGRML